VCLWVRPSCGRSPCTRGSVSSCRHGPASRDGLSPQTGSPRGGTLSRVSRSVALVWEPTGGVGEDAPQRVYDFRRRLGGLRDAGMDVGDGFITEESSSFFSAHAWSTDERRAGCGTGELIGSHVDRSLSTPRTDGPSDSSSGAILRSATPVSLIHSWHFNPRVSRIAKNSKDG
jgi:hypothetical protein